HERHELRFFKPTSTHKIPDTSASLFFIFGLQPPSPASAIAPRGAHVAPVRGSTYFSLQRQRKVGKRKPLGS
ncbi:hypothetical protein ACFFIG_08675, partial [Paraburkholderia rhizosphaerae]|uniref:hypothetical protein n=1 Tax=Paraburkholderia rhizosphaerae TaxID=480658 RepID=UPI0035E91994